MASEAAGDYAKDAFERGNGTDYFQHLFYYDTFVMNLSRAATVVVAVAIAICRLHDM